MHPAFSVIFFTTLSGAGYGLLAWVAVAAMSGAQPARPLLAAVVLALLLVTVGLLSSVAHLGKPQRAWRAFSQWRTSWLSREGVAALLTYLPALLLGAALLPGMVDGQGGAPVALGLPGMLICVVLIICTALTVYCTAMIYASLIPIPAWRHRLVVPVYFGFALLTGGLLLLAIAWLAGSVSGDIPATATTATAIVVAIALWLAKSRYWRDIDAPLPATRGDAVGLPDRTVTRFERPNTEANYITREMGFAVARKHSRKLRTLSVVLFAAVPTACLLLAWLQIAPAPLLALAALSSLVGTFVERWLFFAEARHMVTLYY